MTLANLFTSKSKFQILSTLSTRATPIHLRALSELANVSLRSTQLAVAALEKLGAILRSLDGNRVSFRLNPTSIHYRELREFFSAINCREIEKRAKGYSAGSTLFQTLDQLHSFSSKR